MLVIRDQQIEEMRVGRRLEFERELLREGRRRYPGFHAGESDADLGETIRSLAEEAESRGMFLREHIARFVFFVMEHGLDAKAQAILEDPSLVGIEKLARLEGRPRGAEE